MADFGVAEGIALAGVLASVGTTVYAASQKAPGPKMPKVPEAPKLPETQSMVATAQQADLRARSAGGTILSDQNKNKQLISDGGTAVRKSLLGM